MILKLACILIISFFISLVVVMLVDMVKKICNI